MLQQKHLYSIKLSLKFVYSRKQSQYLYLILQALHFLSSCPNLHLILWNPSETLFTRLDNELAIDLALPINCNITDIFFVICSPFLSILIMYFFTETVGVMYFSVFSPKIFLLFYDKIIIMVRSIMKNYRIFLGRLYFNYICYAQHLYIPLCNEHDL